jgi:molybdate transport system substrate-binding protein
MVTPLKLLSSMATREILGVLAEEFHRSGGIAVAAESAGGVDVARRVKAGEAVDVVVLAAKAIDELIADGRIVAGSRVDLVHSGIAAAVRAGAPTPAIDNEAAVRSAVEAAPRIAYSTGPSGVYLEKLFARWGMAEAVKARTVQAPPGIPVGSLVAKGEADLGFQQYSELMNLTGITILGPLPPDIQLVTTFSAGVATATTRRADAEALIAFMAAPATADLKRRCGMDPA